MKINLKKWIKDEVNEEDQSGDKPEEQSDWSVSLHWVVSKTGHCLSNRIH